MMPAPTATLLRDEGSVARKPSPIVAVVAVTLIMQLENVFSNLIVRFQIG